MISLDNWSSYVYNMIDIDFPVVAIVYGLTIIIFGSYVVMNLILAVIIDTFIQLHEEELKKEINIGEGDLAEIIVEDDDINKT
jgi:Ion transport protein